MEPIGSPNSPTPGPKPHNLTPARNGVSKRKRWSETPRVPPTARVSDLRFSFWAAWCAVHVHGVHGVPISMPGRAVYAPSIWHAREMTAARGLASPESQAEQREQAESEDRPSLEVLEVLRRRQAVGLTCPRVGGSAMASHLPRARTESACSGKCLVETPRSGVSTHCKAGT